MYWINGNPEKKISFKDFNLYFGDGFFTTAPLKNGQIPLFIWHIERLLLSAKRLLFKKININILHQEINIALNNRNNNNLIKIIISRGNSNLRGYSCKSCGMPLRIILLHQIPSYYTIWQQNGIKLNYSPIRLSRNSMLAGIKHLNRLEQVLIKIHIDKNKDIDEALVLDTKGYIVECCSANIFWRYKKQVFTPLLCYAGVKGIMRRWVMNSLPLLGYKIQEVMSYPIVLKQADEVFITNALIPIASVNSIGTSHYKDRTLSNLLLSKFLKY